MQTTRTLATLQTTCPTASVTRASDEELVEEIARGDKHAMNQLFARHNVRVYRFVARLTGNTVLAEDVVSDAFFAVWQKADSFKGNSKVSTWLLAIARNKAIAALRRSSEEQLDDQTAMNVPDAADNPEESASHLSRRNVIRKCLMQLPLADREILDLVYYHERSLAEVAEIVGIPCATAKTRVFYARKRLAELLDKAGIREFNA